MAKYQKITPEYIMDSGLQTLAFRQSERNEGITTNLPTGDVDWTIGRNVRFRRGAVYKTYGKRLIGASFAGNATAGGQIRNMFTFKDVNNVTRHLICTDVKIYAATSTSTNFDSITDITPSPAPNSGLPWSFSLVGGYPVLSNGSKMWYWAMSSTPAFTAMTLIASSALVTDIMSIAPSASISWMNRLWIANGMKVGWTGISDITNTNIDATPAVGASASGRAGMQDLLSPVSGGNQVESIKAFACTVNDLYAFSEQGVWMVRPIASPYDYSFTRLPQDGIGILSAGLSVTVNQPQGSSIFYMGNNDVYVIDNGIVMPIGFPVRNAIFPNINKAALSGSFAWYNQSTYEVFFCVPTGTNAAPDTAFVYNIETKGWSICDCTYTAATSAFDADATQWVSISNDWNNNGLSWSDATANGVIPCTIVGDTNGEIYKFDGSPDDAGNPITAYIETRDFGDGATRRQFFEFIPGFKYFSKNKPVMIQFGVSDDASQTIMWDSPQLFTPGTLQRKVNSRKEGFYGRIRIYSNSLGAEWAIDTYSIKWYTGGVR